MQPCFEVNLGEWGKQNIGEGTASGKSGGSENRLSLCSNKRIPKQAHAPKMQLEIKPSHKPIKQYYDALAEFEKHGATKETSVRAAFQEILTTYARKKEWSFIAEEGITLANGKPGAVDGAIKDAWGGIIGYWEAKDV